MANSPNWAEGYVPSAAVWNALWASKADALTTAPIYNVSTGTFQINGSYNIHLVSNLTAAAVTIYPPNPLLPGYSFIIKDVTKIVNPNATFAALLFGAAIDGVSGAPLIQTQNGWAHIYTPDGVNLYRIG